MTTIAQALREAVERLTEQRDSARLDAEVLLMYVLDKPRSHLYAWPERTLSPAELARFETLLARRVAGEPVAHLTGRREFWSLPLSVTADTLIPRPETEILVEQALAVLPPNEPLRVADLGTGSGAIALAIARERPQCRILATDISAAAIAVAQGNARRLGIDTVTFRTGDWCESLSGMQPDMIVSNPPYIADADPHLETGDVRYEPRTALAAGPQGMDALTVIARCAPDYLQPGGWLLMEHGHDQGKLARQLLELTGLTEVIDYADDAGLSRVIAGRCCPE